MTTKNFQALREDFPMLSQKMRGRPLVYLDNAATTLRPRCVSKALQKYYEEESGTVHRGIYELSEKTTTLQYEVRQKIQAFINASSEKEIVFTSGTTASINLLASSFGETFIEEGDEILISEIEHHSNLVPWQLLCKRKKAHLKIIPVLDSTELDLQALKTLLNEKTKLVSLFHVSNAFGCENPLEEIVQIIRERSKAKIAIDGAQSVAHQKVDVQALDLDFYAFSAHKMYGPTGVGVLYGKEELLEKMPPYQGGGDMIEEVSFEKTTYNELPFKFEAGTPNIAGILAFGVVFDYLNEIGLEDIRSYEHDLLEYATLKLKKVQGVKILGDSSKKGPLISFVTNGFHPLDVATLLDLKGIALRSGHLCAQPGLKRFNLASVLRISFSFYNTRDEVDYFIGALEAVLQSIA